MRSSTLVLLLLLVLAGCAKERPVEAPVVEVAIGGWDGGTRPLVIEPPAAPEEPRTDETGMTGRWEGIGRQDDGQTWLMIVEISTTNAGVCATADYPSVPCRAEWLCTNHLLGGTLMARERLLDDSARRCIDNGSMTIRLQEDGTLDWVWSGAGQSAHARLRRVE